MSDGGLQAERTALAWRRTALAVGVCALVLARVMAASPTPIVMVVTLGGLTWSADLARTARSRHRRARAVLEGDASPADGRDLARASGILMLLGVLAAFSVVLLARVH